MCVYLFAGDVHVTVDSQRFTQGEIDFLVVSVQEGADELDPPPAAGISSSVVAFCFPDFAPPLSATSAALFVCSRAFRLSAFAQIAGLSAFFGGGIDFLLWEAYDLICSKPPKRHMPRHIEGHPGRGHVEMRGVPGPSGCGARDPVSALSRAIQHHAESESPTQFAKHSGIKSATEQASINKTEQHQRDAPREQQWKR